jgi:hypothetical protein
MIVPAYCRGIMRPKMIACGEIFKSHGKFGYSYYSSTANKLAVSSTRECSDSAALTAAMTA